MKTQEKQRCMGSLNQPFHINNQTKHTLEEDFQHKQHVPTHVLLTLTAQLAALGKYTQSSHALILPIRLHITASLAPQFPGVLVELGWGGVWGCWA